MERIHRVGVKSVRPRAVVLKFLSFKDREAVWEQRRELKGTRLFLEEHYAVEIQQSRQQLLPFLTAAQKRGERAALVVDKLLINGQKFTSEPNNLHSLQLRYCDFVKAKSEVEIETKDEGGAVCFYGKHSVFSNFYLNPMEVSGQKYSSNEQFYTVKKCEMSDKPELALRASRAKYPLQANSIGRSVKLEDDMRIEVMKTGLLAKFGPEGPLRDALMNTGNKMIAEASPFDMFWGTGCGLRDPKLKDSKNWKGQNQMGKLLMSIRESFKNE